MWCSLTGLLVACALLWSRLCLPRRWPGHILLRFLVLLNNQLLQSQWKPHVFNTSESPLLRTERDVCFQTKKALNGTFFMGFFPLPFISLQVGPMTGRQATISPAQRENCYVEVIKMTRGFKTIKHSTLLLKKK